MKQRKRNKVILAGILFLLFSVSPLSAAKHNPFARPGFLSQSKKQTKAEREKKPETTLANLSLTGIINNRIAIINHQFYRKGQKIGIMTIVEIDSNKVILQSGGARYDLILNLSKIKKKE